LSVVNEKKPRGGVGASSGPDQGSGDAGTITAAKGITSSDYLWLIPQFIAGLLTWGLLPAFRRYQRRRRRRPSSRRAWKSTHRDENQPLRRDQPRRIGNHVEFMRGAPIEGRLEQRGLSQPKRRPSPANFHFGTSDKFGGRDFRARAHPNNR